MDRNMAVEALSNLANAANPAVILAIAAVALIAAAVGFNRRPRGKPTGKPKIVPLPTKVRTDRRPAYERHLRDVCQAEFEPRKLMSKGEYRVFATLEAHVGRNWPGMRVMAQVSLGEIIRPKPAGGTMGDDKTSGALWAINGKRVDVAVIDAGGFVVAAIEYQGGGHYQGDAAGRDAVKREALRKAGIPFVEIQDRESAETICSAFDRALTQRRRVA